MSPLDLFMSWRANLLFLLFWRPFTLREVNLIVVRLAIRIFFLDRTVRPHLSHWGGRDPVGPSLVYVSVSIEGGCHFCSDQMF
ncbi:hypothetical protein FKM82_027058 [Ascaphus truei]